MAESNKYSRSEIQTMMGGGRNESNEMGGPRRLLRSRMPTQRPLCRFYRRGHCHYGDHCRFLHDASTTASISNTAATTITPTSSTLSYRSTNSNNAQFASTSSSSAATTPSEEARKVLMYDDWVKAPEFVPAFNKNKTKSYAEVVNPTNGDEHHDDEMYKRNLELCPYAEVHGICTYTDGECTYVHGDICDMCQQRALHPYNDEKRKQHIVECVKEHEKDMEMAFAIARSKEKSCGVCFEVIMEKSTREQRFGILPNCNHCFCLSCIRKWRQAKQFDNKIIRACPECRVTSDFVCPSMYWVDTKEEKEKLITDYKCALSQKNCKYFKQGRGKCPFGNKCFYLHALPDGTKTDVGPPPRQPRRHNHDGELDVLQQFFLWDFLDDRENRWLYSIADGLEDLVAFFSDSDDSDWSEYEIFME